MGLIINLAYFSKGENNMLTTTSKIGLTAPHLPTRIDTSTLNRALVGFDTLFNQLQTTSVNSNYPPYNIIKKDDDHYVIEVAVAGFKREELTITMEQETLTISGSKEKQEESDAEYLHRGLSSRDFARDFKLAEHVVVNDASLSDGILCVFIERIIPEEKKLKVIPIA